MPTIVGTFCRSAGTADRRQARIGGLPRRRALDKKPWALCPRVDLSDHLNLVAVDFIGGDGAEGSIPCLEDDDRNHERGSEGSTHAVDAKA